MDKERRLQIYKDAREYLVQMYTERPTLKFTGICAGIKEVKLITEPSPFEEEEMQEHYPELYAYKPDDIEFSLDMWWDSNAERLRVLDEIIAKMEEKENGNA